MSTLTVLDVGHGSCSVISSEGKTVVLDAANRTHLLCYLESKGIRQIDLIVISHTDLDHVGGLLNILSSPDLVVKRLVINPDGQKKSKIWGDIRALVDGVVARGELDLVMSVVGGKKYEWADITDGLSLEVISPSTAMAMSGPGLRLPEGQNVITGNSASIVLRVVFNNIPVVLVTADMDSISLSEIQRCEIPVKSDFLIFPHHGGLPGNADPVKFTQELIAMVEPKSVIFSNGRGLHGTPKAEIIKIIKENVPSPYIACTQLSLNCCAKPMVRDDFKPVNYSAGAMDDAFCAGTIEIDLINRVSNEIALEAHISFISGLPSSLCGQRKLIAVTNLND